MSLAAKVRAARAARKQHTHTPASEHTFEAAPSKHDSNRAHGRKASKGSVFGAGHYAKHQPSRVIADNATRAANSLASGRAPMGVPFGALKTGE